VRKQGQALFFRGHINERRSVCKESCTNRIRGPCQPRNSAPASNPTYQWEGKMEVKYIQGAIILAVIAFLILCIAIRPLREWLFGPTEIGDGKGFPWSRHKHR
jgi:hypothetical protein